MKLNMTILSGILLLFISYLVFRRLVRKDYREHGKLRMFSSLLQLVVFIGYFSFPYLFNPPEWASFWRLEGPTDRVWQICGLVIVVLGLIGTFGTMAWFGIGKAFGMNVNLLTKRGPYRVSRNPQVLGGYLLVIGISLLWPSLYSVGWIVMYGFITHWMVVTEEEHLFRVYGEEYKKYCSHVPRYLFLLLISIFLSFPSAALYRWAY
jgi:protein-S-isoprenylcysteine O-methyltransferase Ste14